MILIMDHRILGLKLSFSLSDIAVSGFRPLHKIHHCCLLWSFTRLSL